MHPNSPHHTRATLIGLSAPLCWGMSVGLTRCLTESFGMAAGLAVFNWVTCAFLLLVLGLPDLKKFSKKFLFLGVPMGNVYTICYCLSLYLADGPQQVVEVGMVNYLWPCLVVLFAVLFNGQKVRWWLWPGVAACFFGLTLVLGGERGIRPEELLAHIRSNPWSYGLAFAGAVTWGIYSNVVRAWSNGQNPALIVFTIDALMFTALWAMGYGELSGGSLQGWISVVLGGIAVGGAYAAWNYGVTHGNITLIGIASYFTPVLSCLFSSWWIGASISGPFWLGVAVLVAGSLVCWHSTRSPEQA